MPALFFGSIGTLSDTSELQRAAFNRAFREHGLDWRWDRDAYRAMLQSSGGQKRIEAQAEAEGIDVDAAGIHATKSKLFQAMLDEGLAQPRPGVKEAIARARSEDTKLGFVSSTSRENIDRLLSALDIAPETFDVITSADDVSHSKPAPDVYHFAAARLGLAPEVCTAVEDNADGVRAALAAGMACIAWPNENTAGHDFTGAEIAGEDISQTLYPKPLAAQ